jgi:hypothetical protein
MLNIRKVRLSLNNKLQYQQKGVESADDSRLSPNGDRVCVQRFLNNTIIDR